MLLSLLLSVLSLLLASVVSIISMTSNGIPIGCGVLGIDTASMMAHIHCLVGKSIDRRPRAI